MFLQFPEPVLGRTRSTRKDSVTLMESFGIGMTRHGPGNRGSVAINQTGLIAGMLMHPLFMKNSESRQVVKV